MKIKNVVTVGFLGLASLMSFTVQAGTELKFIRGALNTLELENQSQIMALSESADDYVIQYQSVIREFDKTQLQNAGIQIFRYLPDDALIVRASSAALAGVRANNSRIHAVVPFHGDFKLSDNLPILSIFSVGHKEKVLISAFTEQDANALAAWLKSSDQAQVLEVSDRYITTWMDLGQIPSLTQLKGVEFVEKVEPITPFQIILDSPAHRSSVSDLAAGDYSDLTGYETGTKVMNFDAAWTAGFSGEGQVVSMADTGLDSGNSTTIFSDFKDAIPMGYVFGPGSKSWEDPMGHGTHVSGSVMGRGTTSGGRLKGGAYSAKMVPESMWSPLIDNLAIPPHLEDLFDRAAQNGAHVHTNSWGSPSNLGAYDSMAQKVDDYMWKHPDFLILFAAGNSGVDKDKDGVIDHGSVSLPGTAKNALTVGASENLVLKGGIQKKISELRGGKDNWGVEPIASSQISDNPNGMAMFSSRGPSRDGRLKPEIVAPGTNILSVRSHHPSASDMWGRYNDDYVWSGGTSMATPLTAGAAAVTREVLVKKHQIPEPSAALVKAVMMHTAFDMYPGQYGTGPKQELTHRPNNDEGYGRVDMKAVVSLGDSTGIVDNKEGVGQGEAIEIPLELTEGQSLLVNMVYTDAAGTPSSAVNLVNNLDLTLIDPSGHESGSRDTKNNNEIIEMKHLAAGAYKVRVAGINVPMGKNGKQPYALVYTVK